jgi:hypothetical protein
MTRIIAKRQYQNNQLGLIKKNKILVNELVSSQ